MKHRYRTPKAVLVLLAAPAITARAQTVADDAAFLAWNAAFNRSLARADTAALRPMVADHLTFVVGLNGAALSASQLLSAVARRAPSTAVAMVDSVRVQRLGARAAVVTLLRTESLHIGTTDLPTTSRVVEVFARRDGRWVLTHYAPVWRAVAAPAIAVDTAALDAFVGRYELGPGYVDRVARRGGQLVATVEGQRAGAVLVPASATTFRPNGGSSLIAFERDAAGRVVGYVLALPDGRVLPARRVR